MDFENIIPWANLSGKYLRSGKNHNLSKAKSVVMTPEGELKWI
jgi:hypothetical protein